ncbi:MAG: hypothetical protein ACYCOO_10980, partial [Chitinophagaceae bacterium]
YLKFALYGALIANFFLIPDKGWIFNLDLFILIQIGYAIAIGLIESLMARLRMKKNSSYIFSVTLFSGLIFIGAWLVLGKLL